MEKTSSNTGGGRLSRPGEKKKGVPRKPKLVKKKKSPKHDKDGGKKSRPMKENATPHTVKGSSPERVQRKKPCKTEGGEESEGGKDLGDWA